MSHSRREFLRRGLLAVPAVGLFPGVLARSVLASPGSSPRYLILVDLRGGNDGFNTVVPYNVNGGTYYSAFRPNVNIGSGSVLPLDAQVGLNPMLAEFKSHYDAGRLAVIQGVSFPTPSFSHEVAERIWTKATDDPLQEQGWLAKLLSLDAVPSFPCAMDVSDSVGPFYHGADRFVPAFQSVGGFQFPYDGYHWSDRHNRRAAFEAAVANSAAQSATELQQMAGTSVGVLDLIDTIAALPEFTSVGVYPEGWFSSQLQMIARLINGDLGLNVFHVGLGGFDTHSDQDADGYHSSLLQRLSQGVNALHADLTSMGKAGDALFVVYSEFGRTIYENGSFGTDHGTVNPVFVLGDAVTGGLVTAHPAMDPSGLDVYGEAPMVTDLRDVFGTVIHKWFGVSPSAVLLGYNHSDLGFLG